MSRDTALLALLAAVTGIGPFAMQALAPALPAISDGFSVGAAAAQLLLSLSLIAMAVSNLVWGPLSDRFGRRPVLIWGMAMAAAGSLLAAAAPLLGVAILGRLAQAAGAAAGMVLARAVAQDVWGREGAAKALGQITAAMVVAPMLAPALSGLIVEQVGWRGIFVIVGLGAAGLALWVRSGLVETAPPGGGRDLGDMLAGFGHILRSRRFWRHAGFAAFSLASFLFFVGAAPYVMEETFGRGPAAYGFWFMLLAGAYMVANLMAGWFTARFGGERMILGGSVLALAGSAGGVVALGLGAAHPAVLFLPVMCHSIGAGLALPNAMAGALAAAPDRAGSASGLMGAAQFLFAALTVQVGGFMPHGSAWPLMVGVTCLTGGGLVLFLALAPGRGARVRAPRPGG